MPHGVGLPPRALLQTEPSAACGESPNSTCAEDAGAWSSLPHFDRVVAQRRGLLFNASALGLPLSRARHSAALENCVSFFLNCSLTGLQQMY